MEQGFVTEHQCPICGKIFATTPEWVYKRGSGHNFTYLCSWSHLREWDEKYQKRAGKSESQYKDKIIDLLNQGYSWAKTAEMLGVNISTVKYHAIKYDVGRKRE